MFKKSQEIEIKYQLTRKAYLDIRKKLRLVAKFVGKAEQVDKYYTPAHRDFLKPKFPFEWLRIRKKGNKAILNYKHWYPENCEVDTHCDEYETEISDYDKLKKILSALDFKFLVKVENQRETYLYKNQLEIVLDQVKGLGYFVEIEATKKTKNINKTRNELFAFAKELEVDRYPQDLRGYPYNLLINKELIKS